MRIALVYDCLYPYTVGGAERWYRDLTQRLAARHQVAYLTRQQWGSGETPEGPVGVEIVVVSGGRKLYAPSGRRNISAPLRFGFGVLWYLLRHRRSYDIVHTCGFPYFSVIAARVACAFGGPPVIAIVEGRTLAEMDAPIDAIVKLPMVTDTETHVVREVEREGIPPRRKRPK
jgi:glycosyltransferase involved in cell wall biosynthesis